jgi:hypothetical protein
VLLVLPDQWPRALLRAALREAGYDALGAPSLAAALRYRPAVPDRGPVRLALVDQAAVDGADPELLGQLLRRHGDPAPVLLARATHAEPEGPWRRVLRRPASIADIVSAVQALLPLAPGATRPID